MSNVFLAGFLIALIAAIIGIVALPFKATRHWSKRLAAWSSASTVVLFVSFGIAIDREEKLARVTTKTGNQASESVAQSPQPADQSAPSDGFASDLEREQARYAGFTDGAKWKEMKETDRARILQYGEKIKQEQAAREKAEREKAELEAQYGGKVSRKNAGTAARSRPSESEIVPSEYYAKCHPDFSICKGKFVKFEGVIKSIDGFVIRISTPMHGFDVILTQKMEADIAGSKVIFSGFLAEDHIINDDVSEGQIDAVLMNRDQVNAEKRRLEAQRAKAEQEKAELETERERAKAEACERDLQCIGNEKLIEATFACQPWVERMAKNDFQWTDRWYETKFERFRWHDKTNGTITYIGDKIKFQNGFGAWVRSIYECDYNFRTKSVSDVRIRPGQRLPD